MEEHLLTLDARIRDFVLFPISIVMFLQGILRQNISGWLKTSPPNPKPEDLVKAYLKIE
jgi:hypothetical protein